MYPASGTTERKEDTMTAKVPNAPPPPGSASRKLGWGGGGFRRLGGGGGVEASKLLGEGGRGGVEAVKGGGGGGGGYRPDTGRLWTHVYRPQAWRHVGLYQAEEPSTLYAHVEMWGER